MKIQKYILEITVFLCGAIVMVFELVGSRVLGPYYGTSIFVWTGLIGIILGSLSLGYYLGGMFADKKATMKILSLIIFLSAVFLGITILFKEVLLTTLPVSLPDNRVSSIVAAIILFSPTSILLGMVTPYAVKLKISDLKTTGRIVGNLSALSTAGSITGTFLAGFYLIPTFGTNALLIFLVVTLVLMSIALFLKQMIKVKAAFLVIMLCSFLMMNDAKLALEKNGIFDFDTAYNRIWISDYKDSVSNMDIRRMGINNENHSAMYLQSEELVNEYTKYYHLVRHFFPEFKTALMFGGAGYSFPKDFLKQYPQGNIDVIEIDPQTTALAKKYFNLKDDPRLNIYHEDGRVYLNTTQKKYDVIFGDAFGSRYSVPYQLSTKEAVQKKFDILNENGLVILNIISSLEGEKGQFLRAEYATYKSIFPQTYLFPVLHYQDGNPSSNDSASSGGNGDVVQNIMLVALKSQTQPTFISTDLQLNEYLQHFWQKEIPNDVPILTDDYAPVDYYINKLL
jgi:spermidine synthase